MTLRLVSPVTVQLRDGVLTVRSGQPQLVLDVGSDR